MSKARGPLSFELVVLVAALIGVWLTANSHAQTSDKSTAIVGGWTLNKDLSSQPPDQRGDDGDSRGGREGGFGRRGRFGGGGRRGGGLGGGANDGPGGFDREAIARQRDAMRDIMNPPDHLVIADTGSMIVITGPDGRTTRLSPDGKKIKDENTKIERKTSWDGGKLVSEINGLGPNKLIQTYSVDPERHQLTISVTMNGGRNPQQQASTRVYDRDSR